MNSIIRHRPETIYQARAIQANIVRKVQQALSIGQIWYDVYLKVCNSKLAKAKRHAICCRTKAVVLFDRNLFLSDI